MTCIQLSSIVLNEVLIHKVISGPKNRWRPSLKHCFRLWEWTWLSLIHMHTSLDHRNYLFYNSPSLKFPASSRNMLVWWNDHSTRLKQHPCESAPRPFVNLNVALPQSLNVIPIRSALWMFVRSPNSPRYTPCGCCALNDGRWSGNERSLRF